MSRIIGNTVGTPISPKAVAAYVDAANALKGQASGEVVRVDDVSPIGHAVSVKVSGENITPTNVTVTRCGKNLFDIHNIVEGYIDGSSGAVMPPQGAMKEVTTQFIPISIGKRYVISSLLNNLPTGEYQWVAVAFYDAERKFILRQSASAGVYVKDRHYTSCVAPDGAKYVRASVRTYGHDNAYLQLEMSENGTPTDYEQYDGETCTPSTDGTAEVTSLSPTMTLFTDTDGAIIDVEYNKDTNRVMGDVETALDSIIAIQNSLLGVSE